MAIEMDRIFVAIGISKPDGNLDELPGAITAATRMAEWAASHGYLTVRVHDQDYAAVSVDLLRQLIGAAIDKVTARSEFKRIIVFFAGHGAAQAMGDPLLSHRFQ